MEDKYEESDYEETNHMTKSSSISLSDLQREEYILDNENKDVERDWVLPIIQNDMISKK